MVTSAKMEKTIVVKVTRLVQHKLYDALCARHRRNFTRMTNSGEARLGDTVRIVETRPMSKLKRWRLAEVRHAQHAASINVREREQGQLP